MFIEIDRKSKVPMAKQIYVYIKEKILSGNLPEKYKLPSTRSLANELSVSRNVVLNAYGQLFAEGYIYSKQRTGIFVGKEIRLISKDKTTVDSKSDKVGLQFEGNKNIIDFRTGVPNLSLFPKNQWGKIYRQICIDAESQNLDYYEPGGSYELRYSLAGYLSRVRGVNCSAENIIITSGAAQSFSLLAQYFSKVNNIAVTEDPISSGIIKILDFFAFDIRPVPLDINGIKTDVLPNDINPSLIFTTPSHQFPTGAVLPINRRIKLIEYAQKTGAYIVEDDYDSEFRFQGYPIQSMQSLAPENIIYVGTFSKTLCPALRIGYMIVPKNLLNKIKSIKYIDDLHSPVLEQLTLARFINEGFLDRHISISKKHYSQKSAFLVNLINQEFGGNVEIFGHTSGIHIMAKFHSTKFEERLTENLRKHGVNLTVAEDHSIKKGKYINCALFGFGNLNRSQIEKGIKVLKNILANAITK